MSTSRFTRLPQAVFDALERGDINKTQFIVLSLLHLWAGYTTGRIDSFCAERVCRYLHIEPTPANLKAMRRQIAPLREMGWFHDDYQRGSKRPYHVWLHNYVILLVNDAVHDKGHENVPDDVHEETVLNPCEIKFYQRTIDFDVPDNVPDGVHEFGTKVSAKDQYGVAFGSGGQEKINTNNKANPVPDPDLAQADDLLAFIWDLVEFTRPKAWALGLLKKYPLLEIKYAIAEFVFSDRHSGEPSERSLMFFFKESMEQLIHTRRMREGSPDRPSQRPPTDWSFALARLAEKRTQNPDESQNGNTVFQTRGEKE
jgi:hypothetical protein